MQPLFKCRPCIFRTTSVYAPLPSKLRQVGRRRSTRRERRRRNDHGCHVGFAAHYSRLDLISFVTHSAAAAASVTHVVTSDDIKRNYVIECVCRGVRASPCECVYHLSAFGFFKLNRSWKQAPPYVFDALQFLFLIPPLFCKSSDLCLCVCV